MSRTVFCKRYKKQLEGLSAPPFPGPEGEAIFNEVSLQAWQEWLKTQVMLINERRLKMTHPEDRTFLNDQRSKFLNGEALAEIEGYIPPD